MSASAGPVMRASDTGRRAGVKASRLLIETRRPVDRGATRAADRLCAMRRGGRKTCVARTGRGAGSASGPITISMETTMPACMRTFLPSRRTVGAFSAVILLAACHHGGDSNPALSVNTLPGFVSGSVRTTTYDGNSDDLLTAGLGRTGLASSTLPGAANPASPTAAQLRRHAILSNYRALVDMTADGGYGRFCWPDVDLNGNHTLGRDQIAGTEYLAHAHDGRGNH